MLNKKKGFTLIEVIITVVISGILAAASFPLLKNLRADKEMEIIANDIYNDIKTTKLYAIINIETQTFKLDSNNWEISTTEGVIKKRNFTSDGFTISKDFKKLEFKRSGLVSDMKVEKYNVEICNSNSNTGYKIEILKNGEIKIEETSC